MAQCTMAHVKPWSDKGTEVTAHIRKDVKFTEDEKGVRTYSYDLPVGALIKWQSPGCWPCHHEVLVDASRCVPGNP